WCGEVEAPMRNPSGNRTSAMSVPFTVGGRCGRWGRGATGCRVRAARLDEVGTAVPRVEPEAAPVGCRTLDDAARGLGRRTPVPRRLRDEREPRQQEQREIVDARDRLAPD